MAMIASKCPTVRVTVVDLDASRIAAWNSPNLPIFEPGLDALVASCRGKNLFFSTDVEAVIAASDIIFVSVNTPTKTFGVGAGFASDVKNLERAARTIAAVSTTSKIIVEKSTVPVRTAETLRRVLSAVHANNLSFPVLSNPEFLAEGTAVADLDAPSRVLIGGEPTPDGLAAVATLSAIYAAWVPASRIITTNTWSSELSKLVANAFLAQRISSINAISGLCEATGADVSEVARAVGADPRIGPAFLKASVGFGGSCFQKDILNLVYLCRSCGLTEAADYWQGVVSMNEHQKARFARKIVASMFSTVSGKRIAMLGWAFKADTGDVRESPAAYVTKFLLEERASIAVYDPQVKLEAMHSELAYGQGVTPENTPHLTTLLKAEGDAYAACAGADAVVVLTEWKEFAALDWAKVYKVMRHPSFVFDGRNVLDHAGLRKLGFECFAIGKPVVGNISTV